MSLLQSVFYTAFPFLRSAFEREQWTESQLRLIPAGETLLDVGAGECMYRSACAHLRYVSQDSGQYDGRGNDRGLQTGTWNTAAIDIVSDACAIPVEPRSFQNILCTEVLEHLPHPERAIHEFSRILTPGGRLILTAPFWSVSHFAPFHYCTGFSTYWYENILADHGFAIVEMRRTGNYFSAVIQELIRAPFQLRRCSRIGVLAYAVFLFTLPAALALYLFSFLTKGSEELLCFSVCVLARKMP